MKISDLEWTWTQPRQKKELSLPHLVYPGSGQAKGWVSGFCNAIRSAHINPGAMNVIPKNVNQLITRCAYIGQGRERIRREGWRSYPFLDLFPTFPKAIYRNWPGAGEISS